MVTIAEIRAKAQEHLQRLNNYPELGQLYNSDFMGGVDFVLQLLQQTYVSRAEGDPLPLLEKAIDDTFNQVHYSHLHPDVVQPMEHGSWREKWIKDNCGNGG